jgi:hypothetical protein
MSDCDLELYETELMCIFLPCHGLTEQLPYYVKTSKYKLSEDLKVQKVLSLNMYSKKKKKISVLKVYGKSKKTKEYVIWIKLNRLIYVARLFLWPFLKRKLSKEIL